MPENELEILPPLAEFPLLEDHNGVIALFDERLADGGGLPLLDLPRIKVAPGGVLNFIVQTQAGEELVKKLEGIVVAYRTGRVYWKSRAVGKKPPDCSSIDGFTGKGDPGGICAKCPFALFGSGFKQDGTPSTGQACKEIRQLLFLMKGEMLPHLLNVPPTSIRVFDKYTMTMLSAQRRYWGTFTEMTLEKAQSTDQIDYAKIVFRVGRRMNEEAVMPFKLFHERMRSALKPAIIDSSAYEILEEPAAPAPPRIAAPRPVSHEDSPDGIPF